MNECNKITYESNRDAKSVAIKRNKYNKVNKSNYAPLRVYKCPNCNKYHLTSKKTISKESLIKNNIRMFYLLKDIRDDLIVNNNIKLGIATLKKSIKKYNNHKAPLNICIDKIHKNTKHFVKYLEI